jgi:hypothetical protein
MSDEQGELVRFIATHVRYHDYAPQTVDKIRLLERTEEGFEDRELVDRDEIMEMLEADERIFTWDAENDGLGPEINVEYVNPDAHQLRVDGEEVEEDDLGDLPEV